MEGIDFGHFDCIVLTGSTSASADTALGTLPVNPFNRVDVWAIPISGAGVYIEDDGTHAYRASGILAATIDIRSTVAAAEPFKVLVMPIPTRPRTISG